MRLAQRGHLLHERLDRLLVLLQGRHLDDFQGDGERFAARRRVDLREAALAEHVADGVAVGDVVDRAVDDVLRGEDLEW